MSLDALHLNGRHIDLLTVSGTIRVLKANEETSWDQFKKMLNPNERLLYFVSTGIEAQCEGIYITSAENLAKLRELGVQTFGKSKMAEWTTYYALKTLD